MNQGSHTRDHGGGIDAAVAAFGGRRADWLDLSTGINPQPYPVPDLPTECWTALPDQAAMHRLLQAAKAFWQVPDGARILAAPGASALIARLPYLTGLTGSAYIPGPTYNEHAAAMQNSGRLNLGDDPASASVHVYVHPNNPDGSLCAGRNIGDRPLTIIDESFCDVMPEQSHVARAADPGVVILKSFGKFWGLAGLRLGFAIAAPETLAPGHGKASASLSDHLGPWAVSGPALEIGARALEDHAWASTTRVRLAADALRLDALMTAKGTRLVGGTSLFRLYDVGCAAEWQSRLARHHIWSRVFPYSDSWLRLGLPDAAGWDRLAQAIA